MSVRWTAFSMAFALLWAACGPQSETVPDSRSDANSATEEAKTADADRSNITFETIQGGTSRLADFRGHVLLIVNVASECGYTPQYAGLEALFRRFSDSGLVVIGFPANNFGGQEPGTNEQILTFCRSEYDVTFPMMAKVSVKDPDKHPLFVSLTEHSSIPGEIAWNFSKFLLDRDGNLVARFPSKVEPLSDELLAKVEELL